MPLAQWVQAGNDIDGYGSSLDLSSNGIVLALGSRYSNAGGLHAGQVAIFVNTEGAWMQRGNVLIGASTRAEFGYSVALSADGGILAVGSNNFVEATGSSLGKVSVLKWHENDWRALGPPIDGEVNSGFGAAVALSDDGTVLAVGALFQEQSGQVTVFTWEGTSWNQRGDSLIPNNPMPNDLFGIAVAVSFDGSVVACGAAQSIAGNPGLVQVYRWNGTRYIQQGSTLFGFRSNANFGISVSLSGDGSILAVGASDSSSVTVFQYVTQHAEWFQIGQTLFGVPRELFGWSVRLSLAGDTLVVGRPWNDANGSNSGRASVFRLSSDTNQWLPVGQGLYGAAGDEFGLSVSISRDGTRIAVGATEAGYARVLDLQ